MGYHVGAIGSDGIERWNGGWPNRPHISHLWTFQPRSYNSPTPLLLSEGVYHEAKLIILNAWRREFPTHQLIASDH